MNLPGKLTCFFTLEVEAMTIARRGWRGKQNGELIELA